MRILHAVRQYPPGIGGVETIVSSIAERQAAAGHEVRVLTLDRIFDSEDGRLPARERRNGVDLVRVPWFGSRKYPLALSAIRHVRDADIVHVHGLEFFADFLGRLRFWHRTPLVISTHGGFFHTDFARRLKAVWFATITRATLRRYAYVLGSSEQDMARFRTIVGDKALAIENAVDTAKFAGLARPHSRTMIYFGRVAPNKGLDRLLAWFAGLAARDPGWRLIVAGKEMQLGFDQLRQWATQQGIADAVEFHRAPSDAELRHLIARSSVYAGASTYEGFGLAAVEAAGAGLFPLLSDIAPFRRTLDRLGFGMAIGFEPGADVDRFLAGLAAYEAAPPDAALLAERLAGFEWNDMLERIEGLYARAIAQAGRAASMVSRPLAAGEPAPDAPHTPASRGLRPPQDEQQAMKLGESS